MFVLTWIIVLLSANSINADGGSSAWKENCPQVNYCVTFHDGTLIAEAGLCVVIPCSFTTDSSFTPKSIIWYKCEPLGRICSDADIIFDSKDNKKVQTGFRGRVSLLQPDVSQKNCSIMINNLIQSDSGSYQLRVVGQLKNKNDGFTYTKKKKLSVTGPSQKPTVVIPPLTEGQQTNLTCTAPGLCSGSQHEITWMWRGKGESNSQITENITALKTEDLIAVTQRHSSTLTFNPSSEHHGTNITCKVRFAAGTTTENTLTLNVNYRKRLLITGDTSVKEGDALNLSCSIDSFPLSAIKWIKSGRDTKMHKNTVIHQQDKNGTTSLFISNVTAGDAGLYICSAKHLNSTLREETNVTVRYKRNLQIIGNSTVKEGDLLNLTCRVDSFPPSIIRWSKDSAHGIHLHNDTGSATFEISDITAEGSGQYTCTATYLNKNVTAQVNVTVTRFSKILNGSRCVLQSKILTCVCISEGVPLPTIKWPLLKDHTEYSVTTKVSNNTVNSTFSLTGGNHGNITSVECFISSENGEAKENLIIQDLSGNEVDQLKTFSISWLQVILAFLIGVLLPAVSFCLVIKYYRKKQKDSGFLKDNMEMIVQENLRVHNSGTVQVGQSKFQEEAANRVAVECNNGPKELVYARINYSLLNGRPRVAAERRENTNTIYAEVKTNRTEMENDAGDVMTEEENEMDCVHTVEEATYASVKDLTNEI